MARVTLEGIDKHYGDDQVVHHVSLVAEDGEFVVFVGPSGCGKSTLLRCIAGLESISAGAIHIGANDVTEVAPADRGVAMVFQSYALYPHMSVRANMEFGLKVNGIEPAERERRVAEAARVLQLEDYLERKPGQLSGGQRQRVAIGRAIVKQPQVFLLDEPLSNLDAALRVQMRVELETLHGRLGSTMIYVTHDQVEAMTLADRIVVLDGGRVEQIGAPLELYHTPATRFVAGFIGSPRMNFLAVERDGDEVRYGAAALGCDHLALGGSAPGALTLGVRPEHLALGPPDGAELRATVHVVEALGSESYVHVDTEGGDRMTVKSPEDVTLGAGEAVGLRVAPGRAHLFDQAGRAVPRSSA